MLFIVNHLLSLVKACSEALIEHGSCTGVIHVMKESDIRPQDLLQEYLRLSSKDVQAYFFDVNSRNAISCPACDSRQVDSVFEKSGFGYVQCQSCSTLYQSPRPCLRDFEKFYIDSPSSNFWAEIFFPQVAESRREHIFVPRVNRISDYFSKREIVHDVVMDVGAGYGIFLEEWQRRHPEDKVCAVEPGAKLAATCREKGFDVLEAMAEQAQAWAGRADLTTCFEVIEHAHSPLAFITALKNLSKPGGYVLISGLGVDGFDIQVLWNRSNAVSPPHHLNFMSVKGFELLFERAGFVDIDILTPGELDVDIVAQAMTENPDLVDSNRFVARLISRGDSAMIDFQTLLKKYKLSSHVWVIARRPEEE